MTTGKSTLSAPNPQTTAPIIGGPNVTRWAQERLAGLTTSVQSTQALVPAAAIADPKTAPADGTIRLARAPWRPVAGQTSDAWVYYDAPTSSWQYLDLQALTGVSAETARAQAAEAAEAATRAAADALLTPRALIAPVQPVGAVVQAVLAANTTRTLTMTLPAQAVAGAWTIRQNCWNDGADNYPVQNTMTASIAGLVNIYLTGFGNQGNNLSFLPVAAGQSAVITNVVEANQASNMSQTMNATFQAHP